MENVTHTAIDADGTSAPLAELRQIRERQRELAREEARLVRTARAQNYSWVAIAAALEVSKQAVHKKYGRK